MRQKVLSFQYFSFCVKNEIIKEMRRKNAIKENPILLFFSIMNVSPTYTEKTHFTIKFKKKTSLYNL